MLFFCKSSIRLMALFIAGALCLSTPSNGDDSGETVPSGFHVVGRHLYDRCGERVVLRGVNKMIIDGTDWGKDIDVLQSEGPALIEADPDHNLVFSIHMWWPRMWGYSEETVIEELEETVDMELPLIVGEFGIQWTTSAFGEIPYLTIVEQTHLLGIGMLPWEWGPGNNPQTWLDMTADGSFATLQDWGLEVAVTHRYSILNTAVRPRSMVDGWCGPREAPPVRRPRGRLTPG